MRGLEDSVRAVFRASSVRDGSSVLIGISGGPDSTALLRALGSLRAELGLTLFACIVDHGIRPSWEVEEDVAFVRSLCDHHSVPLTVAQVPRGEIKGRARKESKSLEEVAREERHRLLGEAAKRLNAGWIALGHTQDDELETVLMRFLQGSDIGALAGIPRVRGPLVRPLLGCSRQEILDYLRSRGQAWREDTTNADLSLLRNRVRHVLVPLLAREFPGSRSGVLGFSQKAGLVAELLRAQGKQMGWTSSEHGFSIQIDAFLATPAAVRAAELMRLYDSLRPLSSLRRLPWRFLAPALRLSLRSPAGISRTIIQGHGVRLAVRGSCLCWERCVVTHCKKSYFIEVSGTGTFSVPGAGVRMSFVRRSGKMSPAAHEIELQALDVEWPLVLRSRRRGDEILLERGATPLKELLAGWKLSEGQRQRVPVLADRRGVVAVLGPAVGHPGLSRSGARITDDRDAERIIVRADREHGRGT
jgi:tRNA(Ile)-lysidine synthase